MNQEAYNLIALASELGLGDTVHLLLAEPERQALIDSCRQVILSEAIHQGNITIIKKL